MSRKPTNAYAAFQRGKGLVGFLAGLVLATMIIIAVLLMLNSNSKTTVREPNLTQPVGTDKLSPTGVSQATPPDAVVQNENTVPVLSASPAETASPVEMASPVQTVPDNTSVDNVPPVKEDNTAIDTTSNEPPLQPADDDRTNLPIDKQPLEKEPSEAVKPTTERPPVRGSLDNDGVPSNVRPNHNSHGGNNNNRGSNNTPNRNNHSSGSLKQDDLNLSGVDKQPSTPKPPVMKPAKPVETTRPVEPQQPIKTTPPKTATPPKTETKTPSEPKKVDNNKTTTPNKINDVKPTPQQILDAGNIEKARELARRQAAAQQANKTTTAKPANAVRNGNTNAVVIQAGAYSSRNAAESQRARLALLGVQARVVEANVNGKPTFRVQTPRIEGAQANTTRNLLQKHGVSTLERSAE